MNREDIIRMAHNSHLDVYGLGTNYAKFADALERFAALVAKHTLANIDPSSFMTWQEGYEAGKQTEREACANICEALELPEWPNKVRQPLAQAIRARGQA